MRRCARLISISSRMVDQDEHARHADLEFGHRHAASKDRRGLNVVGGRAQIAFRIDRVEDLADDMEGGGDVRPAVADQQADRLANMGGERGQAMTALISVKRKRRCCRRRSRCCGGFRPRSLLFDTLGDVPRHRDRALHSSAFDTSAKVSST